MASSIVARVAQGAALAASAAALFAALATMFIATVLLQRAEDRRIEEAAVTFASELAKASGDSESVRQVHHDESAEMEHTGVLLAVYGENGELLAGDRRLELPASDGCATMDALRACRVPTTNGFSAVAGAAHTNVAPLLTGAAVLAALFAAALAWVASRPISRRVVAPLTRLRERIAKLDLDAISQADLGAEEHIAEVDALRAAIGQLMSRVERALSQAHRFAANAAHELRTPLTAVRGELELLAESGTDDGAAHAQQKLAELSVLVDRLLILSVPARTSDDVHEIVSLRDLLEDAVQALPPNERSRVHITDADAQVRGDATLLSTMVSNALSNGLKFGKSVAAEISVTATSATLRFDDDGPGLTADERERVFEPFFRSPTALRQRIPGHGLGLALIRHIATTHGGTATFVNDATPGAKLEITLPSFGART